MTDLATPTSRGPRGADAPGVGPTGAAAPTPRTDTHCAYCGLQCAMTLSGSTAADVTVAPRRFPTNRGGLCQKGWTSAELLRHPARLTVPLVRRGGELVETTWDDALDIVARGIAATQEAYGRDGVALFGGGGLTNEKAYQLGRFARVGLRTSQVDYNGRWCMSSAAAAGIRCFGLDRGLPFPVTDVGSAHAVLLLGANPAETMPPFLTHLVRAADHGGLMVADPRLTPTAAKALDGGGLHLQLRPGTDAALALGMVHLAVTEGYADREYIASRTTGFEELWAVAAQWLPERAERVTGVAAASMRAAVRALARARDTERGAYVLSARGGEQHATGTDTVTAFIALALVLGLPGNPGTGFGTITGQGNGQGGREHGQKADQLPATARSTTRPPGPTWPRSGAWTQPRCPVRGAAPSSCSTRSAPRAVPAPSSCTAPTPSCRRPTRRALQNGSAPSTCSSCATSSCPRPPPSPTSCCRCSSGPRRRAP